MKTEQEIKKHIMWLLKMSLRQENDSIKKQLQTKAEGLAWAVMTENEFYDLWEEALAE